MRIVVIDDNPVDRRHFVKTLATRTAVNILAVDGIEGNIDRILAHRPRMVLLDDRLGPVMRAEDSLKSIEDYIECLPTVVMSGVVPPGRRAELIRLGAVECLEKDSFDDDLMDLVIDMAQQRDVVLRRAPRVAPDPSVADQPAIALI